MAPVFTCTFISAFLSDVKLRGGLLGGLVRLIYPVLCIAYPPPLNFDLSLLFSPLEMTSNTVTD